MDRSAYKALGLLLKLLFGGIASFFLLVSLGLAVRNVIIINTYQHASGEVVSSRSTGSGKLSSYEIRVRYDGLKGKITGEAREVFLNYSKGDMVSVYYHRESLRDLYINSLRGLWFLPIFFGVLGSIVSYFVVRMILDDRKADKTAVRKP
ncbi:MAG: DUF3592 domain-containing protein [Acidobacteria bacterium]|nr:DUF3592 domain-containing protein [Acidobacteriota bacterium]